MLQVCDSAKRYHSRCHPPRALIAAPATLGKGASVGPTATILIVDDEPEVREMLDDYLVTHGFETICADSASAARELAARHCVDLALVDIRMPGEDGLSLARHLRERYAKIAIVM